MVALLQGHIVFRDPVVLAPAQLRNQYWWALVGGAKGFVWEAACIVNHFSNRGLLTWALKPTGDGRLEEIERLAAITRRLEDVILDSAPVPNDPLPLAGFQVVEGQANVAIRFRRNPKSGCLSLLLVNRDLQNPVPVAWQSGQSVLATDLARDGKEHPLPPGQKETIQLDPGAGVCYRIRVQANPG